MTKSARRTQFEYVVSVEANILIDTIKFIVTAADVTDYMQLKAISCLISSDIECCQKISWLPTLKYMFQSITIETKTVPQVKVNNLK